ncbi:pyruvate kinase [[Mycobacterium] wendilense]|uniref:Pyruvate kinase n=1 Tax=[Mycobacterium] wendilense TaxID=3064284 RepID=A0ABM9MD85_9MYCO|nr:pyruvate kinase [Mycolicibacterium sp. MU0050]CAJ1582264.1 pyruvate kinase [Mycolicibacterium sp. MU0050]
MTAEGELLALRSNIDDLLDKLREAEQAWAPGLAQTAPEFRDSARNMVHYLAIRQVDLRDLQGDLARLGLSSLGRSEPHVQATLRAVRAALTAMLGHDGWTPPEPSAVPLQEGTALLVRHATALLGPVPSHRAARIMVTMPTAAATDESLVGDLVRAGMDLARINCAHDDPDTWRAVAANVRRAARDASRTCFIAADLAGPKVRTGALRPSGAKLRLYRGDVLELTRDCGPAPVDREIPRIGCTLPEVIDAAEVGHRVLFDDGKIAGKVVEKDPDLLRITITHARAKGAKLRADKGINLPDTTLSASAPTDQDLVDLAVIAEFADLVEMSFVQQPGDVERLLEELGRLDAHDMGLVLKIETPSAFEHLPRLLITAMRRPKVGVMIARGDLAVESGYERLAELQEEIMWLCEAAHVPVIWATQVLEQLAKQGNPSRAEISDAAMSERAEAVMLNKGPYIRDAVVTLDDILRRMNEHQNKKVQLMRPLRSWQPTFGDAAKSPAAAGG